MSLVGEPMPDVKCDILSSNSSCKDWVWKDGCISTPNHPVGAKQENCRALPASCRYYEFLVDGHHREQTLEVTLQRSFWYQLGNLRNKSSRLWCPLRHIVQRKFEH